MIESLYKTLVDFYRLEGNSPETTKDSDHSSVAVL